MAKRKLYRSSSNKVLFGVAGGLGEYFNIDVVLVRVIIVVLCVTTGFPLILYPILTVIMPKDPAPDLGPGGLDEFGGVQRGTSAIGESSPPLMSATAALESLRPGNDGTGLASLSWSSWG